MANVPLNFDQIKDDIEDLAVNKDRLVSRTSLAIRSHHSSQVIDMDGQCESVNNSIADIYIKELLNKHNKPKKMSESISNASSSSEIKRPMRNVDGKRYSINVDINQINFNTNASATNLNRNESASAYTVSSEKSCY